MNTGKHSQAEDDPDKAYPQVEIELGTVNSGYESDSTDDGKKQGGTLSTTTTISVKGSNAGTLAETGNEGSSLPERETWDNPNFEFILSCVSMSVGLGNVWRFPFTAYENGGGAFLIPYFIVLILIGRPIYFMEMCLGQFSQFGQVKVWGLSPFFRGVGYSSAIGAISTMTFYCSIIAVTIYYLAMSFKNPLPWSVCDVEWGDEYCDPINGSYVGPKNTSLSQLYYSKNVFPQLENIDHGLGYPLWHLSICLFAAWLIIFLTLAKGVKSSGKVMCFTAIFPYFVMLILLIRGVTLDGAGDGILYFIKPRWESIYNPDVWFAAISQCFMSLSTCFGTIIMLSSYNPFNHNIYRDCIIISFTDTLTSVLAGLTIFSVLGSLAKTLDVDISEVTKGGPGLAFVSYPEAIAKLGMFPQVLSFLFFMMLVALGVGSATSLAGGIITIICDQYPKIPRWQVTLPVCILGFLSGLIYVTPGGQFILTLVNRFGADFVIYIVGMIEVAAISWIYGLDNFCRDIQFMLGIRVGWYWKCTWRFIPVALLSILIYSFVKNTELLHEGVEYPVSAIISGWILSVLALSFLPICACRAVWAQSQEGSSLKEKIKAALSPSEGWGPQDPKRRQEWMNFETKAD